MRSFQRSIQPWLQRIRRAALAGTVLLPALCIVQGAWAPAALARPGVYAGFGAGNLQVDDGLTGTRAVPDVPAAPVHEQRMGRLETGTGLALNGGFGFNEYLALDLLVNLSRHDTTYTPPVGVQQTYSATVSAVTFGLRGAVPLGEAAELFGRFGISGIEVVYRDANVRIADSVAVDDARFTGRGLTAGLGAELFFGHWGLQLAYTVHDAQLSNTNSLHFGTELDPAEDLTLSSVALLLTYYLE